MSKPFVPVFIDYVQGIAPNGVVFSVSKNYCLSKASAVELAALLADLSPDIVDGPPVPNIGNRFVYSQAVPFFRFADGKVRNAGVLATYWTGALLPNAEQSCRADIADDYSGTELLA
jgi:hypothetical protein